MPQVAELLTDPINFAVVQLPERKFPGVVVQGDTLNGIVKQLTLIRKLLAANQLSDLSEEIDDLRDQLADVRLHYQRVCAVHGIELPYPLDPDIAA